MKRLAVLMSCVVLMSACAHKRTPMPAWKPVAESVAVAPTVDINGNPIDQIPFRAGVSSTTVENLAKQVGCVSELGAGLLTPQGPVEVYRLVCEDRRVFKARCEFRQCKAI